MKKWFFTKNLEKIDKGSDKLTKRKRKKSKINKIKMTLNRHRGNSQNLKNVL